MQPLQLIREGHFCISGNVTIAPSASIAPGVLLQADPNCQLVIAADVCIGAGSMIHADHGILEIASGVTVGAGVLIIGGRIGANACIGARSTLWNVEIAVEQVVATDSLMGETGRTANPVGSSAEQAVAADSLMGETGRTTDPVGSSAEQVVATDSLIGETGRTADPIDASPEQAVVTDSLGSEPDQSESDPTDDGSTPSSELERSPAATDPILADPPRGSVVIYGKAGLNRLMESLFPYRQSLNGSPSTSPTDSDQTQ